VNQPRKRPGFWWLLFYGRRRRGFPWLFVVLIAAILAFALLFAIPGAADASRALGAAMFGLLFVGALVLAVVAVLRPRRRP